MLVIPLLQSSSHYFFVTRGDAPRSARRLPLAFIFRAFGAIQSNFVKREKLNIPFCAGDWRFDEVHNLEPQRARGIVHFLNNAQPLRLIAHNSAPTYLTATYFKLWLEVVNLIE